MTEKRNTGIVFAVWLQELWFSRVVPALRHAISLPGVSKTQIPSAGLLQAKPLLQGLAQLLSGEMLPLEYLQRLQRLRGEQGCRDLQLS